MKALSLWQPWASLIAVGAKQAETRSWPAPERMIGQRIAIHAAKLERELEVAREDVFAHALASHYATPQDLPLGAIVATAIVDRCERMTWPIIEMLEFNRSPELDFGHWDVGRYAWWLRDIERLPEAIPYRGRQGLFDVHGVLGQPALSEPARPPALFDA